MMHQASRPTEGKLRIDNTITLFFRGYEFGQLFSSEQPEQYDFEPPPIKRTMPLLDGNLLLKLVRASSNM